MAQNQFSDRFIDRHIGPGESEINEMLKVVGADSLESLIDDTIPENAYIELVEQLKPIVKSLMFGEACSNVPIFKK